MYNVINIADTILKIAKKSGKQLTPLQLMKLVYIAHGFYLAMKSGDLFNEKIEAWKYGPVIPELYHATKHFGRDVIPFDKIDDGEPSVSESDYIFLEDVFNKYGHLDGIALSSLTHKAGTPWSQVYNGYFGTEIPDSLIKSHYERLVHDRHSAATAGN